MSLKRALTNFVFPPHCRACSSALKIDLFYCDSCQRELALSYELATPISDLDFGEIIPLFSSNKMSNHLIRLTKQSSSLSALLTLKSFFLLRLQSMLEIWPCSLLKECPSFSKYTNLQKKSLNALQKRLSKDLKIPVKTTAMILSDPSVKYVLIITYNSEDLNPYRCEIKQLKEQKIKLLTLIAQE